MCEMRENGTKGSASEQMNGETTTLILTRGNECGCPQVSGCTRVARELPDRRSRHEYIETKPKQSYFPRESKSKLCRFPVVVAIPPACALNCCASSPCSWIAQSLNTISQIRSTWGEG